MSEILGTPKESIIDDKEYQKISRLFAERRLHKMLRPRYPSILWHEFYEKYLYAFEKEYKTEFYEKDENLLRFSNDSLSLLISPQESNQYLFPFFPPTWGKVSEDMIRHLELNVSTDAFKTGFKCFLAGRMANEDIGKFFNELENYDIPTGQSPKTQADSLLKLIETSKKMCLAPMVAAGTMGISQLGQGAYVAAVLTSRYWFGYDTRLNWHSCCW